MSKRDALIKPGYRVGRLTVTEDTGERKNSYIVWKCTCDCGNTINIDKRVLQRGTITDCGCVTKIRPGQRDATGQRFGMLTAMYSTGKKDAYGSYLWHCKCDCGTEVDVALHLLQVGKRKSCGCLTKPAFNEFVGKRFGKLIIMEYAGRVDGIHQWKCKCDCGKEIIVGQPFLQTGKTQSCGCMKAETAHENLKITDDTSIALSDRNRSNKIKSNNTSGHVGVFPEKKTGRWAAQIVINRKKYYLGAYDNLEDAIKARELAEKMFSDFPEKYYSGQTERKKQTD